LNTQVVLDSIRQSFTVPAGASTYAPERISLGVVAVGVREHSGIGGVTVVIESGPSTAVVELWLPRVQDGTTVASTISGTDADYFFSGHKIIGSGSFTHPLAAWPGAQIRVQSGTGGAGTTVVSARSVIGATGATDISAETSATGTSVTLNAGSNYIGFISGDLVESEAGFTRPSNTTAYTAGDIVSNSTTATALMVFANAGRANGKGGYITKARLDTSKKDWASAMRLWLYTKSEANVTIQVDNLPKATTYANADLAVGFIDFPVTADEADTTNSTGAHAFQPLNVPLAYLCDTADTALYGVLTDQTGATPASAQTFRVYLTFDRF